MQRIAVFGYPLRRRHAKAMYEGASAAIGLELTCDLLSTPPADLDREFRRVTNSQEYLGFQVTAPYKQAVLALLERVDEDARAIGAVNTGARGENGEWVGFNTDMVGFCDAVELDLGVRLAGSEVLLLGAGGAAQAVARGCVLKGAARLTIANRTPASAVRLSDAVRLTARPEQRVEATALGDDRFEQVVRKANLVVNATTVGMADDACPLDVAQLGPDAAVFDLVFARGDSTLVTRARSRGLPASNGMPMLTRQGAVAFTRWTGRRDVHGLLARGLDAILDPEGV